MSDAAARLIFGEHEWTLGLGTVRSLRAALERVEYRSHIVQVLESIELEMLDRIERAPRPVTRFTYVEV